MLQASPIRSESPRYTTPLLFLPEFWAPARIWQPVASYLGHRGWDGELLELRGRGDIGSRATEVAARVGSVARPPAIVGHGAGALVAIAAARAGAAAAVVLVAPLVPRSAAVRGLMRRWEAVTAVVRGRPIPPPAGEAARRLFGEQPTGLDVETSTPILDVVRGRVVVGGRLSVPALVVVGELDPLLDRRASTALAADLGAQLVEIPGAGHWPILPPAWQRTVSVVHRWLVQRLGEPLLDFYAEAMADRESADDEPDDP